jgi:glutamine amidotransferase
MILIVDYGLGNLGSIKNMLKKIGVETIISNTPSDLKQAKKIILPGVGSFDAGMKNLKELHLIELLNQKVMQEKTPILGICLGMQLLTNSSEEGSLDGLGFVNAKTIKFNFDNFTTKNRPKILHMGWNTVEILKENILFQERNLEIRFYFAHSYYVVCKEDRDVLSTTLHGIEFTSSFARANVLGVQFHPEKSHKFGMKLLRNFAKYI